MKFILGVCGPYELVLTQREMLDVYQTILDLVYVEHQRVPVYKRDIVPAYNSWTKEQRELEKEKGNPIKSMYTSSGIPLSDELAF